MNKKAQLVSVILYLSLLISCTKHAENAPDDMSSLSKRNNRPADASHVSGASTNTPHAKVNPSVRPKFKLILSEVPVTDIDRIIISRYISQNAVCRKAMEEATRDFGKSTIDENDVQEICELLVQIRGFVPSPLGGTVLNYGTFTEVIVPGSINTRNHNAYLVRITGHKWMLVKVKKMPGMTLE